MNTQFAYFSPDRGVDALGCGAGLLATIGKRCGCSRWLGAWCGYGGGVAFRGANANERFSALARRCVCSLCKLSAANEHTRYSGPLGHRPC